MSKIILSALDTHEILRYMGCPPEKADEALQDCHPEEVFLPVA